MEGFANGCQANANAAPQERRHFADGSWNGPRSKGVTPLPVALALGVVLIWVGWADIYDRYF